MEIDKTTLHNDDIQRFEESREKEYRKLYEQWINSDVYKEIYKDKSVGDQMKIEE
jgi:hypothetical protein